jgi:rare lipoprotein A
MEIFNDSQLTCAMWDMPFNTILKVTNLENGKSVVVRVNDRGPAKRLNRTIDLTKAAFFRIADLEKGLAEVSVEIM